MRRVWVKIVLILGFILAVAAVTLPFIAETQLSRAKELEANYRWKRAEEKYRAAIRLNPFNAEYPAAAGDFLVRQGESREGQERFAWLQRAQELYARAVWLNPHNAEHWYALGKVRLDLNAPDEAIEDFSRAMEQDPYNFRLNYLIGQSLLSVWKVLDDAQKEFIIRRLKYCLQSRLDYSEFVYPAIMYYSGDFKVAQAVTPQSLAGYSRLYAFMERNNLWQYRQQAAGQLDFYRQKERPQELTREQAARLARVEQLKQKGAAAADALILPQEWQGRAKGGKNIYTNGNMYWTGTMDGVLTVPAGRVSIDIQAKGSAANGVFPYMLVELDTEEIGETFVDGPEWKEYSFAADTDGGVKVLSVTFANDGGNIAKNEDRNLFIGEAGVVR